MTLNKFLYYSFLVYVKQVTIVSISWGTCEDICIKECIKCIKECKESVYDSIRYLVINYYYHHHQQIKCKATHNFLCFTMARMYKISINIEKKKEKAYTL